MYDPSKSLEEHSEEACSKFKLSDNQKFLKLFLPPNTPARYALSTYGAVNLLIFTLQNNIKKSRHKIIGKVIILAILYKIICQKYYYENNFRTRITMYR